MTQPWPPQEPGTPQGWGGPVPPAQPRPQQPYPQQPYPQQWQPWQAPMGQPAPGMVFLTLQGNRMTANVLAPTVRIDGWPVAVGYGMTPIPVPPGRHRIEVEMQWMRTYGQAVLDVEVYSGQQVPVFYAPPYHQFARGTIGFTHQSRPGMGVMLLVLAALVLGLVLVGAGTALA